MSIYTETNVRGNLRLLQTCTIVRNTRKIGRNEPCICGSGRKYKYCCLIHENRLTPREQWIHGIINSERDEINE